MVRLRQVLSRASELKTLELLGEENLQLLRLVHEKHLSEKKIKDYFLEVEGEEEFFNSKTKRDIIIDLLSKEEVTYLVGKMKKKKELPFNPYDNLQARNFRKGSNDLEELYNFFEINQEDEKKLEVPSSEIVSPQYALFSHQANAIKEVNNFLNGNTRRALLHMPTGSGKTRTAMNIVSSHLREKNSIVIWLASTEELCEQAISEFQKAWTVLGVRETNIYRLWGNHDVKPSEIYDGLIVASFQKLISIDNKVSVESSHFFRVLSQKSDLIVVDEAHQSVAPRFQLVINNLMSYNQYNKKLLGLSATPGRAWNDNEADKILADYYNKQKVVLKVEGFDNPVEYLESKGYLAKVIYTPLNYIPDNEDNLIEKEKEGDYTPELLKRIGQDLKRNALIIEQIKEATIKHKRIMVFAPSVDSSYQIAFVLQTLGIQATSITSNTSPEQRKRWLNRFKGDEDETLVLCNYGILTTGFDAPKTSCVIIARPTLSLVLYSQMIGRGIRGQRAGGNKEAEIITVVDRDLPGFASVSDAFTHWEDVWQ